MYAPRFRSVVGALALAAVAAPLTAQDPDPYEMEDESWVSIDGTVELVRSDGFTLDYGDGFITVEMDDGDRDADGYKLDAGETVTVYGRIDDDFLETATIEASSVYVDEANAYYYASPRDEEDSFVNIVSPVRSRTVLQGRVTDVHDEEFTLATGAREITVEVEDMPYDPLDDEGYQRIEVGDRVSVTGTIDVDLFEGREFVAETVTEIHSG